MGLDHFHNFNILVESTHANHSHRNKRRTKSTTTGLSEVTRLGDKTALNSLSHANPKHYADCENFHGLERLVEHSSARSWEQITPQGWHWHFPFDPPVTIDPPKNESRWTDPDELRCDWLQEATARKTIIQSWRKKLMIFLSIGEERWWGINNNLVPPHFWALFKNDPTLRGAIFCPVY